jgi:hypothetical protein
MIKAETLSNSQKEILNLIKNINKAWLEGRIEDLKKYFHNNIIMIFPDFNSRMTGLEEIIKSYKDFYASSKTYSFDESDFHIDVFDKTANADYAYHIVYEINNKKYDGTGREIWTFANIDNDWFAVWRFMTNVVDKEIG